MNAYSAPSDGISVIPEPARWERRPGRFTLTAQTAIVSDAGARPVAHLLRDLLAPPTGFPLPITDIAHHGGRTGVISIVMATDRADLGDEGYVLHAKETGLTLSSSAPNGAFYGVQTVRQLLPPEIERRSPVPGIEWSVPCLRIEDAPRFPWRGVMLDEGRHFFGKDTVKRLLDLMALHKLNVFHWHLTEDQGWRIEVEGYPRLTDIGSRRKETAVGGYLSKTTNGTPHGGYYSQEDIREIVAYAQERSIQIVPEIEMPGHCLAALASYPELSCTGGPFEVATRFGIHKDIFCAGKEEVFEFLQAVLDQVIDLFPSPVIHIGGDEAPKSRWKACPNCQAQMEAEGLESERDLQAYFVQRIADHVSSRGRRLMGWNEILDERLPTTVLCQYWRPGMRATLAHARRGGDVIMSDVMRTYLDRSYGVISLDHAYRYDPIPKSLQPEFRRHILGIEAPLWAEFVPNVRRLDWQIFPRLSAYAETGWSPQEAKDLNSFLLRLDALLARLDLLGVAYAPVALTRGGGLKRLLSLFALFRAPQGERQAL